MLTSLTVLTCVNVSVISSIRKHASVRSISKFIIPVNMSYSSFLNVKLQGSFMYFFNELDGAFM
jgi:hypothetical protein